MQALASSGAAHNLHVLFLSGRRLGRIQQISESQFLSFFFFS